MASENNGNNTGNDDDTCKAHSGVISNMSNLGRNIDELREAVKLLTAKLCEFVQRPSWIVCGVMSTMTGIIGILATFILYTYFAGK